MQFYSDPSRQTDLHALPNCEVFYRTVEENKEYGFLNETDEPMPEGFYFQFCLPGCLPDSDPIGPYETEEDAIADCREQYED